MPKQVDHEARRRELAAALRRVVARVGVEGASVRVVAAEAGWSVGAVQHYFSSRDELLSFAGRQLLADSAARFERLLEEAGPIDGMSAERAMSLAVELGADTLPIDECHRSEQLLWLALMIRAARENEEVAADLSWDAVRTTARACVAVATRRQDWLMSALEGRELSVDAEHAVQGLHVILDGLFLQGLLYAGRSPDALREDLRGALEEIGGRLLPGRMPRPEQSSNRATSTMESPAQPRNRRR